LACATRARSALARSLVTSGANCSARKIEADANGDTAGAEAESEAVDVDWPPKAKTGQSATASTVVRVNDRQPRNTGASLLQKM
jgi:hypothetical protein